MSRPVRRTTFCLLAALALSLSISLRLSPGLAAVPPDWTAPPGHIIYGTQSNAAPLLVPGSSGDVYVVWSRGPSGTLYVQRLDAASGNPIWGPDPIYVSSDLNGLHQNPVATPDCAGGIFVSYEDLVRDETDISVQHIDPAGNRLSSDLPISTLVGNETRIAMTESRIQGPSSTSTDGAVLAYENKDTRTAGYFKIFANKVSQDSDPCSNTNFPTWGGGGEGCEFDCNGVTVTPNCLDPRQIEPAVASDGQGGAFIAWEDHSLGYGDIYVQHLLESGELDPTWQNPDRSCGRLVSCAGCAQTPLQPQPESQVQPQVAADSHGGAFVAWVDRRSCATGSGQPCNLDIWAARVDVDGRVHDGVPICTVVGDDANLVMIADGAGGAWLAWDHNDPQRGYNIYCQQLLANGSTRKPADAPIVVRNNTRGQIMPKIASDGRGGVLVAWQGIDPTTNSTDIFFHHILANGSPDAQFVATQGKRLTANLDQVAPRVALTSTGAVLAVWQDSRSGSPGIAGEQILGCCVADVGDPTASEDLPILLRPNPSRGSVFLAVTVVQRSEIQLDVFDALGRRVRSLAHSRAEAGAHGFVWDGRSETGAPVESGIYMIRAKVGAAEWRHKLVRLR